MKKPYTYNELYLVIKPDIGTANLTAFKDFTTENGKGVDTVTGKDAQEFVDNGATLLNIYELGGVLQRLHSWACPYAWMVIKLEHVLGTPANEYIVRSFIMKGKVILSETKGNNDV